MWKFEKSKAPAVASADAQLVEYSHIPDLCKNIDNLHGLLYTMNPIPDDAKWVLDSLLAQARSGLISMTDRIQRLRKEAEELSQRSQPDQSELQFLKLELDNQREQNVVLQKTNSLLMASEAQLKKDLMDVFNSKNQRIAELEEEIANQAKLDRDLASKVVGYERTNPRPISKSIPERKPEADFPDFKFEPIPEATETHSNVRKPEPIQAGSDKHHDTSQFSTSEPEDIPVDDFFVISDDVEQTEFKDKIILWNILARDYGRVVGRGGKNAERLELEYGVRITFIDRKEETLKLIITEGDAEDRRAASEDIINNLPVTVECPDIGNIKRRTMNEVAYQCDVNINKPGYESDYVTIRGRLDNCRLAYKKLKVDNKLWRP